MSAVENAAIALVANAAICAGVIVVVDMAVSLLAAKPIVLRVCQDASSSPRRLDAARMSVALSGLAVWFHERDGSDSSFRVASPVRRVPHGGGVAPGYSVNL